MDEVTLEHRLTVIEQTLNSGFSSLDKRTVRIEGHLATQNGRIVKLEQWQLKIIGAGLFIMGAAPFVFYTLNRMFPQ